MQLQQSLGFEVEMVGDFGEVLGQCSVLEQNAFPAPHTGCQIRHTAQRYADLAFGWIPRTALSANISETLLGPLITEQGENGSQRGNEEEDCSSSCGFACRGAE